MNAATLLAAIRSWGFELSANGDDLWCDGPEEFLTDEFRALISGAKYDLLALLAREDPKVIWRAEVMGSQVRGEEPLPTLLARPHDRRRGHCLSCGDPVEARLEGLSYRCGPCARAAWLVAHEREVGLASREKPVETRAERPFTGAD